MNNIERIRNTKGYGKLIMLTAYDFQTAQILQDCGIDVILVGDSLGNVFQGKDSTREVTLEQMCYHIQAVSKAAGNSPVIGDLPLGTYQTKAAALNSARAMLQAGAHGVKLEGYTPGIAASLSADNIPVMGHIGLLPQTASSFKVTGKSATEAQDLLHHAQKLEEEGCFAFVLECMTEQLSRQITDSLSIPTFGIGAGKYCTGQVLVINDLLGYSKNRKPKFLKPYADLYRTISEAVHAFSSEVKNLQYPDTNHTYH